LLWTYIIFDSISPNQFGFD